MSVYPIASSNRVMWVFNTRKTPVTVKKDLCFFYRFYISSLAVVFTDMLQALKGVRHLHTNAMKQAGNY